MDLKDLSVNWNEIQDSDFKPLPEGSYAATITKTEVKDSAKGNKFLKIELTLLGQRGIKGRRVYENVLLSHSNPEVVTIGQRKLKRLAAATEQNIQEMESFTEFLGRQVGVKLIVETSTNYGSQNRVKSFLEFSEDLLESSTTF